MVDVSYHQVDSSEMAFEIAGSLAMRHAMEEAGPVLLEPIMMVTVTVPEESVGDVIGDLNSRHGTRRDGSARGGMTEVKASADGRDADLRARSPVDHGPTG